MKKFLSIVLVLVLTFSFAACKDKKEEPKDAAADASSESQDAEIKQESEVQEMVYEELIQVYENSALKTGSLLTKPDGLKFEYTDPNTGFKLPYTLFLPNDYDKSKKYPVLLFLHGAGEIGSDNQKHLPHFTQGFTVAGDILSQAIIICPQTSSWWNLDGEQNGDENGTLGTAMRLLRSTISKYNGDTNRIYVTGLSMGAMATWDLLERYGNYFAAAVPVCGSGNYYNVEPMITVPIWIYHGTADTTVNISGSENMYNAIKAYNKGLVKFTRLEGVGHGAWNYAYVDRDMFTWMFMQNKKSYQSLNYTVKTCFKVVAPDGTPIFTDQDLTMVYYVVRDGKKNIQLMLESSAVKRMQNAYSTNAGGIFTVYFFDEKLYDFKIVNAPESTAFNLLSVTDDEEQFQKLYKTLTTLSKNSA